jgi:tRNA (guanine-N7-)-methyltransferase
MDGFPVFIDRDMAPDIATTAGPLASLVYRPPSYIERLDLGRMFPVAQPLELELGMGDGSFLLQWARSHPERNFLGVERLLGRLRKVDRKGRRAGLANLRLIRLEAAYFLEYLMPQASVQALHLYFPDPWPKRKHWRHRLVQAHFAEVVAQALALGGVIYLRTDSAEYFAQMQSVFGANAQFRPVQTPAELTQILTDFERDFLARGLPTFRAAYQKQG